MSKDILAFPVHPENYDEDHEGMTLRDYFAAKAMQGIVSQDGDLCDANYGEPSGIAYAAYHLADAMLAAREKS